MCLRRRRCWRRREPQIGERPHGRGRTSRRLLGHGGTDGRCRAPPGKTARAPATGCWSRGAHGETRPGSGELEGEAVRVFKRNPFGSLFGPSRSEDFLAHYVLREHARGRSLTEILDDNYVQNRSTPAQRARLLDRPEVVAALGDNALEELRR